MLLVVEVCTHGCVHGLGLVGEAGFNAHLLDVAWLAEVQVAIFFYDMDAEEGLEVVRLGENVLGLQRCAELVDEVLVGGGDGKVVDVNAEEDTGACLRVVLVEKAVIVGGASIAVFKQKLGERRVEG